jgi:hypothetical protein
MGPLTLTLSRREREQTQHIAEHALVSRSKQTTTRQAKHALGTLAHMVESVLGYMLVYEASDCWK